MNVSSIKTKLVSFSPKTHWREIVAVLVIILTVFFFKNEKKELSTIIPQLKAADKTWLTAGFLTTIVYVLLQSGMYVQSFYAVNLRLDWRSAITLFLKRNFLSIFLPAGGVSSLAYTPSQVKLVSAMSNSR